MKMGSSVMNIEYLGMGFADEKKRCIRMPYSTVFSYTETLRGTRDQLTLAEDTYSDTRPQFHTALSIRF